MYLKSGWYMADSSVAIRGYDAVAYFFQRSAIKGLRTSSFYWKGKEWRFSTQENLDAFKAAPEQYAPLYDGYCAFGCSESHQAIANPRAWAIISGKLNFNYSKKYKKIWIQDTANRINAADVYWASLSL